MAANPFLPVIFAADPWDFIIGAIVFFFWLIGQFVGSREEAKPKPRRPRPQPNPARDVDEPVVVMLDEENKPIHPPVQDQAESLRSEIEEFVRRAQGKPAQQKPAPQKPAARKSQRPRQPVVKRVPREPRPAPAGNLRREGVGEHVSKHISSADISQHAEQLGKELEQTDERMESRLHAKFDHQLGSLQHRETTAEEKTPQHDAAAEIAALLSRPEGMRQLILANEILRRPEW